MSCFYKVKKNLSVNVLLYFTLGRISRQKKKNYNKYTHITLIKFIQYYRVISRSKNDLCRNFIQGKTVPTFENELKF